MATSTIKLLAGLTRRNESWRTLENNTFKVVSYETNSTTEMNIPTGYCWVLAFRSNTSNRVLAIALEWRANYIGDIWLATTHETSDSDPVTWTKIHSHS